MPVARTDIMTLPTAVRRYNLDARTLRRLYTLLQGKELKHLGWQEHRGWFYRTQDIDIAIERVQEKVKR